MCISLEYGYYYTEYIPLMLLLGSFSLFLALEKKIYSYSDENNPVTIDGSQITVY